MNKNSIRVKCIEGFELFNNDKEKTLSAIVEEKEYETTFYKPTEEYFANDSEGREFLVGELDMFGNLVLEKGFQLIV